LSISAQLAAMLTSSRILATMLGFVSSLMSMMFGYPPADAPRAHAAGWFRGGAIRFCAVQLGGAESLLQIAVEHLRRVGRAEDLMQIERIGRCAIAVEGGRAWLARSGRIFDKGFERNGRAHVAEIVLQADMTRMAIERICLDVMEVTTRSVGVAGLLRPHPLERALRDLMTYLAIFSGRIQYRLGFK
jgi:alkylation response protein AidB-like acyl-CoA dehydrogenase